jgi:uncharacterized membrane protein
MTFVKNYRNQAKMISNLKKVGTSQNNLIMSKNVIEWKILMESLNTPGIDRIENVFCSSELELINY